jgi:hypothetical protein
VDRYGRQIYARIGQLHSSAAHATTPEAAKVYNSVASRLLGKFRRRILTLNVYRGRLPKGKAGRPRSSNWPSECGPAPPRWPPGPAARACREDLRQGRPAGPGGLPGLWCRASPAGEGVLREMQAVFDHSGSIAAIQWDTEGGLREFAKEQK